jgi:hypothetical protein
MRTHRTVAITRTNQDTGITETAWRPPISTDPFASRDPALADIVWVPDGDPDPGGLIRYEITEALVGTSGQAGQGQWGVCYTCREEYPLAEMALINGRYYCFENGDAEEAKS